MASRLLALPTELRLEIYKYFLPPAASDNLAYLYRSPGRRTKYGPAAPGPHKVLFSIGRQIRDEVLDAALRDKRFVLEASLYEKSYRGLFPIPGKVFPDSWMREIRRLVLFTVFDLQESRRMADLRILQQMTGLEAVLLVFGTSPDLVDEDFMNHPANPVRGVLASIPKTCRVRLGVSEVEGESLIRNLGSSLSYILNDEKAEGVWELTKRHMDALTERQGVFNGSDVGHDACVKSCWMKQDCVNSCLHWEPKPALKDEGREDEKPTSSGQGALTWLTGLLW